MSIRRRSLGAAVSIASRTLFFLYISVKIYTHAVPEDVVVFFQLLFLQSVLITFLSASGYFRALENDRLTESAYNIRIHIMFSAIGAILIPLLYVLVDKSVESPATYLLLGLGAGMTSISGSLSGRTLRERGPLHAFGPSTVSALICILLVFIRESSEPNGYLALIVVYQSITAVILLGMNIKLLSETAPAGLRQLSTELQEHLRSNFLFGSVNTYAVLLLYVFRELWSQSNDPKIVSAAFFLIRISDIGLQLFMTVLASHAALQKLPKLASIQLLVPGLAAICVLFAVVVGLHSNLAPDVSMLLIYLLVSQALIDIVRYPLASVFLYQVTTKKTALYVWYVLLPVSIMFLLARVLDLAEESHGIYLFIGGTSVIGAFVFAAQSYRKSGTK